MTYMLWQLLLRIVSAENLLVDLIVGGLFRANPVNSGLETRLHFGWARNSLNQSVAGRMLWSMLYQPVKTNEHDCLQ